MKKFISKIVFAAAVLMTLFSCENKSELNGIAGDWHYAATESDVEIDVYLSLYEDYTFNLYQKIGEGRYRLYEGTFAYDGAVLSGKYSSGVKWAYSYNVVCGDGSLTLEKVGVENSATVYEKKAVPFDVRNNCTLVTKSADDGVVGFL